MKDKKTLSIFWTKGKLREHSNMIFENNFVLLFHWELFQGKYGNAHNYNHCLSHSRAEEGFPLESKNNAKRKHAYS